MLENLDSLSAFILSAGSFAWVAYLVLLLIAIFKLKSELSTIVSIAFWIISDFAAIGLTALMYKAVSSGELSSLWWYPAFVVNYAFFSVLIFAFHKYLKLKFSDTSILIFGLIATLATLDLLMHIDRMTFLLLESAYHFAVPALKFFSVYLIWKTSFKSRSDVC